MTARYPSVGLSFAAVLLAGTCAAFADDDCYCLTSAGARVALGEVSCLKTNKGMQEARCDMVLNTTSWIFTGKSCPVALRGIQRRKNAEIASVLRR